ncbi:MAG: hypothetical protein M3347_05830, partial [Armatimonadota bacterium]|nr:hypothetical protein [Armatimonadota bacterium]
MIANHKLFLFDLFKLQSEPHAAAAFRIAARPRDGRWRVAGSVTDPSPTARRQGWWAIPLEPSGDAPDKYHPKYVMALLTSRVAGSINGMAIDGN